MAEGRRGLLGFHPFIFWTETERGVQKGPAGGGTGRPGQRKRQMALKNLPQEGGACRRREGPAAGGRGLPQGGGAEVRRGRCTCQGPLGNGREQRGWWGLEIIPSCQIKGKLHSFQHDIRDIYSCRRFSTKHSFTSLRPLCVTAGQLWGSQLTIRCLISYSPMSGPGIFNYSGTDRPHPHG